MTRLTGRRGEVDDPHMVVDASSRGLTVTDVLDLRDIPQEGLRFRETLPVEWLGPKLEEGHGLTYAAVEPGTVDLSVEPLAPIDRPPPLRIHGKASLLLRTDCVRCLEVVERLVVPQIDVVLFPADAKGEEGVEDPDRDDGRYEREQVDLPEILRETLLLELDMNPVCDDGIGCDARTKTLLEQVNRPAQEMLEEARPGGVDPRWAALKDLMERKDDTPPGS
ncbi:MAG: DUF177 domain-containing protein [Myxococcales bacterium]|nr:DUF177 domain-containing protein [Myxococcales bacterium]